MTDPRSRRASRRDLGSRQPAVEPTTAATDVIDHAVTLVGGRSYFRKSVMERLVRDMHAARFHPPSAPVSHQMVGIRRLSRH